MWLESQEQGREGPGTSLWLAGGPPFLLATWFLYSPVPCLQMHICGPSYSTLLRSRGGAWGQATGRVDGGRVCFQWFIFPPPKLIVEINT